MWIVLPIGCFVHSPVPELVLAKIFPTSVSFASAEQLLQSFGQLLVCSEAGMCCCVCGLVKCVCVQRATW